MIQNIRLQYTDSQAPLSIKSFLFDRNIHLSVQDFLLYQPTDGAVVANYEIILAKYSLSDRSTLINRLSFQSWDDVLTTIADQRQFQQNNTLTTDAPTSIKFNQLIDAIQVLRGPISVFVPVEKVTIETIATAGGNLVFNQTNSYKAFLGDQIDKLLKDPKYKPVKPLEFAGPKSTTKTIKLAPDISVWLWSKTLGDGGSLEGGFFNLTPFIIQAQTNVSENGGNFSLSLPPVTCACDVQGFRAKVEALKKFSGGVAQSKTNEPALNQFVYRDSFYQSSDSSKRNQFLFHNMIQANDLIFIKFERLEIEQSRKLQENQIDHKIGSSDFPGQVFDMIALVDSNDIQFDAPSNSVYINIQGRDLMKLLLDDGTYAYPLEATQREVGTDQGVGIFSYQGVEQLGKSVQRIFGRLDILAAYTDRTIEFTLQFLINILSNVKICGNDVFKGYGDARSTKYNLSSLTPEQLKVREAVLQKRVEIWKNTYPTFTKEDHIRWAQVETAELSSDLSKRIEYFETNLLFKVDPSLAPEKRTAQYREFDDNLKNINTPIPNQERRVITEEVVQGIWQIIKLIIDPGISNRRIVDASLATDLGPLINFARKVCLSPFVEFMSDTYGDQFYFIARRSPWTKDSYLDNYTIEVEDYQISGENFKYDDREVYSWYRLTPQGNYFGQATKLAYLDFPAVFLPEYAEIFGSRPLDITSNYIDYLGFVQDEEDGQQIDYLREQAMADLRFLIETHAYLPFTRKGSITIKGGDRRIKRGMNIYHKGTGEIFYVDAVQNTYQINAQGLERVTVVNVSRGMIRAHYDKYFRIVKIKETVHAQKQQKPIPKDRLFYVRFDSGKHIPLTLNDVENPTTPSLKRLTIEKRRELYEESKAALERLRDTLPEFPPQTLFKIIGHTDSDDSTQNNQALSERRAANVKQRIIEMITITKGVIEANEIGSRIVTLGKGESDLVDKDSVTTNSSLRDIQDPVARAAAIENKKAINRRIILEVDLSKVPLRDAPPRKTTDFSIDRDLFTFFMKRKQWCSLPDIEKWEKETNKAVQIAAAPLVIPSLNDDLRFQ